jgi:hypothetical protein
MEHDHVSGLLSEKKKRGQMARTIWLSALAVLHTIPPVCEGFLAHPISPIITGRIAYSVGVSQMLRVPNAKKQHAAFKVNKFEYCL